MLLNTPSPPELAGGGGPQGSAILCEQVTQDPLPPCSVRLCTPRLPWSSRFLTCSWRAKSYCVAPAPTMCPHRAPHPIKLQMTWALNGVAVRRNGCAAASRPPSVCQNTGFAVGRHEALLVKSLWACPYCDAWWFFSDSSQCQTGTLTAISVPSRAGLAASCSGGGLVSLAPPVCTLCKVRLCVCGREDEGA